MNSLSLMYPKDVNKSYFICVVEKIKASRTPMRP